MVLRCSHGVCVIAVDSADCKNEDNSAATEQSDVSGKSDLQKPPVHSFFGDYTFLFRNLSSFTIVDRTTSVTVTLSIYIKTVAVFFKILNCKQIV